MTEHEQEQYDRIYCEVEDEARDHWIKMFGVARRFEPNSPTIQREAERRVELLAAHVEALKENAWFDAEQKSAFKPRAVEMAYAPMDFAAAVPSARITDRDIVGFVASEFGMTFSEAICRLASLDFKRLEESNDD